jgi:hypothetical protein
MSFISRKVDLFNVSIIGSVETNPKRLDYLAEAWILLILARSNG